MTALFSDLCGYTVMSERLDPEEVKVQEAFAEHQQNAPKMDWATDIRTLVQYNHGFAVMSTNSKSYVLVGCGRMMTVCVLEFLTDTTTSL